MVGVPVRHRHQLPRRRALRPGGRPRRLDRCCGPTTRTSRSTASPPSPWSTAGDLDTTPGDATASLAQIADAARADHARRRDADRARRRPHDRARPSCARTPPCTARVALVLLDAHCDTNDSYYGQRIFHGTPFRRAVEEGLLLPERSVMAGMRGPLYDPGEWERPRTELGFDVIPCEELRDMIARPTTAQRVRDRVGDAPVFLSFDIDVIDPASRPATGHAGGRRPAAVPGAALRAGARRAAVRRLRRRRGVAAAGRSRRADGASSQPTSPTSSSASICFVTGSLR